MRIISDLYHVPTPKETITQRLDAAIADAKRQNNQIHIIYLTAEEWEELIQYMNHKMLEDKRFGGRSVEDKVGIYCGVVVRYVEKETFNWNWRGKL